MKTMRASVLRSVGEIEMERRAVPEPARQEVLVQVTSVGVCGSDTHYYTHGRIGDFVVRSPLVLGHEAAGRIVAVGTEVDRRRVGERVAIEPGVPDLVCDQCLAGRYNLCGAMRFFATPPVDGAFAEYVTVHTAFAHALPDTLSDDAGALLEPLSVGIWACRKGAVGAGSRVLVTGAGPIGLVAVQVARAAGAQTITAVDINPHRLEVARAIGATEVVDPRETDLATGGRYDVLLECSGSSTALRSALPALRPAGTGVLVGMGEDEIPLPIPLLQGRELALVGTFRYANTWPTAIALASAGKIDLDGLVSARFGLEDVPKALLAGRADPTLIKALVEVGK